MLYVLCFVLGCLLTLASVHLGFRLGRAQEGVVPAFVSLPSRLSGYYPTQEEMDDASDQQREA